MISYIYKILCSFRCMHYSTHRQFSERRLADTLAESLFLELEQLNHKASETFVSRRLGLNVLRNNNIQTTRMAQKNETSK